nr:unnamed protein product [Callosobruchus analis]
MEYQNVSGKDSRDDYNNYDAPETQYVEEIEEKDTGIGVIVTQKSVTVLSLVLKRIEHRFGRLEKRLKRRRRRSGTPSYSDDSRSYRSSSGSSSSSYADPIDQETLDVENTHTSPPNEHQETSRRPSDELISIFTAESDAKQLFSAPIQPELAVCWTRILSSGLAVETKENIIKKHLPTENCQELSPPLWSIRKSRGQLQKQIGAATSAIPILITHMLKKEGGANREYIEPLNDIGRVLYDVHYNESVSRRALLCLNLNKDFKEALKDSPIEKLLFGSNLVTTLKTAKELEKSTEQLKVPKKEIPSAAGKPEMSGSVKEGNTTEWTQTSCSQELQRSYPQTKHSQHRTWRQARVGDKKNRR